MSESVSGEALFDKVRRQLPAIFKLPMNATEEQIELATGVSFAPAEKAELALWVNGGKPVEGGDAGRDLLFASARHRVVSDLLVTYGVSNLASLPPEAFKGRGAFGN